MRKPPNRIDPTTANAIVQEIVDARRDFAKVVRKCDKACKEKYDAEGRMQTAEHAWRDLLRTTLEEKKK